jgi:hypothetical protein
MNQALDAIHNLPRDFGTHFGGNVARKYPTAEPSSLPVKLKE